MLCALMPSPCEMSLLLPSLGMCRLEKRKDKKCSGKSSEVSFLGKELRFDLLSRKMYYPGYHEYIWFGLIWNEYFHCDILWVLKQKYLPSISIDFFVRQVFLWGQHITIASPPQKKSSAIIFSTLYLSQSFSIYCT